MSKLSETLEQVLAAKGLNPEEIAEVTAAAKAAVPAQTIGNITPKVSEKAKVLSVYGLQNRRPVNLYAAQWVRFFNYLCPGVATPLHTFIIENAGSLSFRSETERAETVAACKQVIGK